MNPAVPTLSIGLPLYQAERHLSQTLDSILEQDFSDFELIISDNASTDATEEICRSRASEDPRIRYSRVQDNQGAAANYNRVFALSGGRYFKWAGHDDILLEGHLRQCVSALESGPRDAVLAYPRTLIIDDGGVVVRPHADELDLREDRPSQRLAHFARKWGMCNPVFGVIRRDALERSPLIGSYISSDVTLLAQLAVQGRFLELPERLFMRRVHSTSSRQGDVTLRQVATWFHPDARTPRISPRTAVTLEILRMIRAQPLPTSERARCAAAFASNLAVRRARVRAGSAVRSLGLRPVSTPPRATGSLGT